MKPLCFFDIETTGLDKANDRIISLAATRIENGTFDRYWMFNPGRKMAAEVIAVHGITNEMLADKPRFQLEAEEIFAFLAGCDVAGFNLINFDVPFLWEEFYRAGRDWNLSEVAIIDVCEIYRRKERRDLTAALKFYCNAERKGGHDARVDVADTHRVLNGQLAFYPDLSAMSRAELAGFYGDKRIDLDGRLERNQDGEAIYAFGKDKGMRLRDNVGFAHWMLKQDFITQQTKVVVRRLLENIYAEAK